MCRLEPGTDLEEQQDGRCSHEGKIEKRGTRFELRPGLHVGWRGTRARQRRAASGGKGRKEKGLPRASPDRARWTSPRAPV